MDNGHILALTGAELDAALARAQNALPRDGSAAMTGALRIFENRGVVNTEYGESVTMTYLRSILGDRMYSLEVGNFGPRYFEGVVNNPWSNERLILHTGNKPSGSYTGNGSAEARPIDVGGVGNVIVLFSGYGVVFVTGGVAHIIRNDGSVLQLTNVSYGAGVLNLSTDDPAINLNSVEYNYQVL